MIYKHNGNVLTDVDGKWISGTYTPVDPYNPLNLPPKTIRLLYPDGFTPTFPNVTTVVQISQSPNIWDLTYNDSNWAGLLYRQTNLLEVLGANTTGVTDMHFMFSTCESLTSVSLFDTSSVTNMNYMFEACTSLTTVPLFDTSKLTTMESMFWYSGITSVPLFNTSRITTMRNMFTGCRNLSSVPLFDTTLVTNMNAMFYLCSNLTTVPLFDTALVTDMESMFNGSGITYLPLFNTRRVTTMSHMLFSCGNLTTIPLFNTSNVYNMDYMCAYCPNVQSGALALYRQASTQSYVPHHTYTFTSCGSNTVTGAAELRQIPDGWKGL